ncbi:MAG TPA: DUF4190 domain-containing protein [Acetivibrio sp.]|nr:DUF4190 domain-containing protein [Acetivibrio sp.]
MKFCPNCGYSNEDFSTVCGSCGSALNAAPDAQSQFRPYEGMNMPVQVKTNSFAIASLVLGILSLPLMCCCYTGIIPGILGIIFGFLAKGKIKASNGLEKGDGFALAGIILGFIGLGLAILGIIIAVVTPDNNELWNEFLRELEFYKAN